MKAVKLCRDCGRPIKNDTNFRVVCDGCLRKKEEARRDVVRSLENEDAARRAAAMGISYGQYVARGLDQP